MLEIGTINSIACELRNIDNLVTVTLSRSVDGVQQTIGNVSQTDLSSVTYGNGRGSHMSISVEGSSTQTGINVTLTFDVVQCDDNVMYYCTVGTTGGTMEKSQSLDVYSKYLPVIKYLTQKVTQEKKVNHWMSTVSDYLQPNIWHNRWYDRRKSITGFLL